MIFLNDPQNVFHIKIDLPWVWIALGLGVIFISTFYLMALTTQKYSITVSSIAAKMSLVSPVLVSLFILNVESKSYSLFNYVGIVVAFPAIIMCSLKGWSKSSRSPVTSTILLPVSVFIFGGVIDSSINFTNHTYLTSKTEPIFPIVIFSSASFIGLCLVVLGKERITLKNIAGGVILGVINYFSIYFLLRALTYFNNDGAILYPLLNIGIILLSAIVSVLFFHEKLSALNKIGILLALLAIALISYQELTVVFNGI